MMEEAGNTLKDLREVAGLTRDELSDALNLKDRSLVEAIENGTAIMSFELILRLAAVLARHDPVPVVLKFTRTYNPELWKLLQDWGFGRLSLNYEREREFINIYRRHDAARLLSDEGFEKVLDFTRAAFEMALHFAAEQENIESDE
jgi:transcriptional regulator with XRE-family HTH domain